jgi:hypothetical protein
MFTRLELLSYLLRHTSIRLFALNIQDLIDDTEHSLTWFIATGAKDGGVNITKGSADSSSMGTSLMGGLTSNSSTTTRANVHLEGEIQSSV